MPRIRKTKDPTRKHYPEDETPSGVRRAATQVVFDEFVGEPTGKPKPKPKRDMEKLLHETEQLKNAGEWQSMTPKHFVALYCLLHQHVYGVLPDEVRHHWRLAVGAATRQLNQQFGGDKLRMVGFMRWAWNRERKRHEKRGDDSDFRMGWRLQFGPGMLVDYRVALNKKGRHR